MSAVLPPNRRIARDSEPPPAPRSHAKSGKSAPAADKAPPKKARRPKAPLSQRIAASRWFQRLQLITGIVVVISASVLVAWGLRRYLRSSPRFAVKAISVDGNHRRGSNQILKRAGLEPGHNVFSIDEQLVEAAIEADPWIADATVSVELPATVRIAVEEREARALAAVDGELYLSDSRGALFKRYEDGDPHDLPVLTGLTAEAVARDRDGAMRRVRRALELVHDLEQEKLAERYPIQEVHMGAAGDLTVTLGADAVTLAFGKPPYRSKIAKAERILEELRYRKVEPAVIFLDNRSHPERVVVRMR